MTAKENATSGQLVAGVENGTGGPVSASHFSTNGHGTQGLHSLAEVIEQNLITPEQAAAETTAEAVQSKKFVPLSLAQLMAMPPKEWLIEQVIGAQDMAMLYGPPGSGKTFVVIDLLLAACTGSQWAMRFDVSRRLSVAYCAGEGISGLPARFAAAAQFRGIEPDALPNLTFFQTVPQLYDTGTAEHITQFVSEWQERSAGPLDLLVVDTLHAATVGAEENSASDMGRVLQAVRFATKALGCAVLLVHHTNKAGNAERGSSSLRGAMDAMISVKKVSEESTSTKGLLQCEKLKDGEAWKPQTFDLVALAESVRVWWDEPAELSQSQGKQNQNRETLLQVMTEHPGGKFTANRLAETIGMTGSTQIYKLIRGLVEAKDCQRELEKPDVPASSRNPWVYFVESEPVSE